ncbi:hypothetical protein O6H91_09G020900 [Diphasiastrum complanatum]|uniref:Uncharacterized protein n=1 Tax=Diphasiastrum complanatum TaxID=34168 RepID=A0ACC2CLY2_DIPCM|nr:hypothetical protein O6H91_09G020900 [Diphasiastrum complanatum]
MHITDYWLWVQKGDLQSLLLRRLRVSHLDSPMISTWTMKETFTLQIVAPDSQEAIVAGDNTGRLLKYSPSTQESQVLLRGLPFANGVALSKDNSFLVVAESISGRLLRYWLKGAKAGTAELFAFLPGYPDNVRRNEAGDFWVAIHCRRNLRHRILGPRPLLRKLIFKLPIPLKNLYVFYSGKPHAMVLKYSADGELVDVFEDDTGKVVKLVSEVEERDGRLWLGTVLLPHIAVI